MSVFRLYFVFFLLSNGVTAYAFQASKSKPAVKTKPATQTNAPKEKKEPAPPEYLLVTAGKGDNVPSLLERYGLSEFDCNVTQFFKINKLKQDYRLKTGVLYKLPIELWAYNGKSIRTTLGINEWKTAVRIENYNKNAKETGLRDDNFIASRQLWVPHHELHCTEEAKEKIEAEAAPVLTGGEPIAAKTTRTFPLFGKKYENTPLLSQKLKGRVYYIVSGHGGPDTGAQGTRSNHTLCEDEYAYDVALRLVRLLVSHGATAYMIVRDDKDGIRDEDYLVCDKDEKVWGNKTIPLDQKQRLQQRCDVINALRSKHAKAGALEQTFVEIHVDSRSRNMKTDVFFYHASNSEVGKKLALRFHQTFLQKYMKTRSQRSYSGTVSARDLYMLRYTNIPRTVYVELGNIRNDYDQQRLVIRSNRQALANWMYEALVAK